MGDLPQFTAPRAPFHLSAVIPIIEGLPYHVLACLDLVFAHEHGLSQDSYLRNSLGGGGEVFDNGARYAYTRLLSYDAAVSLTCGVFSRRNCASGHKTVTINIYFVRILSGDKNIDLSALLGVRPLSEDTRLNNDLHLHVLKIPRFALRARANHFTPQR